MFFYVEKRPILDNVFCLVRSTLMTLDKIAELAERYPTTIYFEAELVVPETEDWTEGLNRTYAVNDCGPGWDDRKAVLDVFYDNGGTLGYDIGLDEIYPALLAVANMGAERMYDYLASEED